MRFFKLLLLVYPTREKHERGMRFLVRTRHIYWILTILAVSVSVSKIIHGPVILRPWYDNEARVRITRSTTPVFYRPPLLDNIFGSNREIVVSVEIVAEQHRTIQHAYHEREAYYKTLPTWMDRYAFLPSPNQVSDDQRVCLVHVGEWS